MIKLSIIIPFHNNVKKYLPMCVNSILNQSFKDYEIILIDDGSTDGSLDIAKEYAKKYQNITLYSQKNKGAGGARNLGIKKAKGKYISFIDADDYITENMYQRLIPVIEKDNLDIVICDYIKVEDNKHYKYQTIKNITDDQYKNILMGTISPVNKIIRKEFLIKNNLLFPENVMYEDIFTILWLLSTKKIKYLNEYLYYYNQRHNSQQHQIKLSPKMEDIFSLCECLYKNIKKLNILDNYHPEIEYLFIRNLYIQPAARFIKFNNTDLLVKKSQEKLNSYFPLWRKNKYFTKNIKYIVFDLLIQLKLKSIAKMFLK